MARLPSHRLATLVVLAVAAGSTLAACGSGSSGSSSQATPSSAPTTVTASQGGVVSVAYRNIAIAPEDVTVHVGQKVRWRNDDDTPHNVTSAGGVQRFASKDFGRGGTFTLTAGKVGVVHYLCTIHPASMTGTITVVP